MRLYPEAKVKQGDHTSGIRNGTDKDLSMSSSFPGSLLHEKASSTSQERDNNYTERNMQKTSSRKIIPMFKVKSKPMASKGVFSSRSSSTAASATKVVPLFKPTTKPAHAVVMLTPRSCQIVAPRSANDAPTASSSMTAGRLSLPMVSKQSSGCLPSETSWLGAECPCDSSPTDSNEVRNSHIFQSNSSRRTPVTHQQGRLLGPPQPSKSNFPSAAGICPRDFLSSGPCSNGMSPHVPYGTMAPSPSISGISSSMGAASMINSKKRTKEVFLGLLCATAQQSYCRHAGIHRSSVRRPSVSRKTRFLRTRQAY